jgi:DNA-binding GntR family transcriptional regulator
VRRLQLSDEVASYLRQAIMAGEYAPGASVRVEAVAEAMDVSATPVREALQALRAEGFLELRPRRGFTVSPLSADQIRDIFVAHALIAGELTARATERIEPEQLDGLRDIHERLIAVAESGNNKELERLNHEFHRTLYLIAGSERLRWALSTFARYVPSVFYSQIDGWPETTAADHSEIFDALQHKDLEAARAAMAQHIRNAGEKLAEYFDRRQHSAD